MTEPQKVVFRSLLLLNLVLISGCEEAIPRLFYFGKTVPNARLEIALSHDQAIHSIFQALDRTATRQGFHHLRGSRIDSSSTLDDSTYGWVWYEKDESHVMRAGHAIAVFLDWELRAERATTTDVFTLIYEQSGTDNFDEEDWRRFDLIKRYIETNAFPDAVVTISVHPAEYTDIDEILSVSAATGISVPPRILIKLEQE